MTSLNVIIGLWIALCLGIIAFTLYSAAIEDRERRAEREAEKKAAAAASRYSHDDDDESNLYWATGTYDPDRYGQFVRSHSYEHREYIRDNYGDLDTYESNRPD